MVATVGLTGPTERVLWSHLSTVGAWSVRLAWPTLWSFTLNAVSRAGFKLRASASVSPPGDTSTTLAPSSAKHRTRALAAPVTMTVLCRTMLGPGGLRSGRRRLVVVGVGGVRHVFLCLEGCCYRHRYMRIVRQEWMITVRQHSMRTSPSVTVARSAVAGERLGPSAARAGRPVAWHV